MSDVEVKKLQKNKLSTIERIDNYSEDMNSNEKIVCVQLEIFNSLNNIYYLLKNLQREGHDVDNVIEEFITVYKLAKHKVVYCTV